MKNTLKLTQLGLIEIPRSESNQISGGWVSETIRILAGLLIIEWDTTKKAAVDAWNGNYDPPKQQN